MNEFDKFIKENRKFWSQFTIKDNGKKLLIEEPSWVMINHANAVFAMILNQAKGYAPVWLCRKNPQEHQLLRSYFPNVEILTAEIKWLPKKVYAAIIAFLKFIKIFFTKDILGFHYNGINYGDIAYDTYLFENKAATIKKINLKLFKIISKCIFRHIKIKNILKNGNYAGVLASLQAGICGGVMLRTALRYGYQGYLRIGHRYQSALRCPKNFNKIYPPYKPSRSDIRQIINQLGPKLKKVFLETLKKEITGKGKAESINAFSKNNKYHTNRASFNKEYKLNPNKKNVFVMLHAFRDQPCSTYRWMLFKDYYEWFIQTLEFAKKYDKVNWIFKQHPSIEWYATKDVDLNKLFSRCPNNIIYIDENKQIDTRNLIYCADLIVTCTGSAGFELPAMGAIPSITAGDNQYSGLGVALEPETKEEYFKILDKADKIEKLSAKIQNRARAAYIYINKISQVSFIACPPLPPARGRGRDRNKFNNWYWNKVCNQYSTKKNTILKELNYYIKTIKKPGFKKLISKI